MGNYLNQDGKKFYEITHSDIYVDKTELLTYTDRKSTRLNSSHPSSSRMPSSA